MPHKASEISRATEFLTKADVLLTGGRVERLTPIEAVEVGGEPMLLQRELSQRYDVSPSQMVLWTGSRVTTHNLRAMLHYAKQLLEFRRRPARFWIIEESFLVRREVR